MQKIKLCVELGRVGGGIFLDQRVLHNKKRPTKYAQYAGDDMVLGLAVTANCPYIVTYDVADFKPAKKFGITAIIPKEFFQNEQYRICFIWTN